MHCSYGDSPEGYGAFVEDQLSALEVCIDKQARLLAAGGSGSGSSTGGGDGGNQGLDEGDERRERTRAAAERRCALLFEALGYDEERVFYHADQVDAGRSRVGVRARRAPRKAACCCNAPGVWLSRCVKGRPSNA